jgi:hypothetical protein
MSVTININGLTLCHKGSNGVSHNTVPDTCYNAKKKPIDFDNEAYSSDLADGTTTVFADGGMMIANFGCNFAKSTLDEGGVGGGVRSGSNLAEAEFMTHSPSVFFEGMPACRLTDKMWMNHKNTVNMAGLVQSQLSPPPSKKDRYAARKKLIEEGKASSDPAQQAAAKRLEENNFAVEQAKLSQHVYDPSKPAPDGWKNISNDPAALKEMGLDPDMLESPNSDFRAQVYRPDPDVFGSDFKDTVAFKGSASLEDFKNNAQQGLNMHSDYYEKAVDIGRRIEQKGADVTITGHSLGGGMASAASVASGRVATTFNPAGLHSDTVTRYGGTVHASDIQRYQVEGEVLDGAQSQGLLSTLAMAAVGGVPGIVSKLVVAAVMPDAVGSLRKLPGSGNPVSRHSMSDVIEGIEAKKAEDTAILTKKP